MGELLHIKLDQPSPSPWVFAYECFLDPETNWATSEVLKVSDNFPSISIGFVFRVPLRTTNRKKELLWASLFPWHFHFNFANSEGWSFSKLNVNQSGSAIWKAWGSLISSCKSDLGLCCKVWFQMQMNPCLDLDFGSGHCRHRQQLLILDLHSPSESLWLFGASVLFLGNLCCKCIEYD